MSKLKIVVGWDDREKVAYEVCKFSIEKHTRSDIQIIPLFHKELRKQGYFKRSWHTRASDGERIDNVDDKSFSTEFSHTRFLVPELMGFNGWALFLDCDMLFNKSDVKEIFDLADDRYAVMCVKHRQVVKETTKMDGSEQRQYPRKNWSSFMLINCGHPSNRKITRDVVNTADGAWLHALSWLEDREIGELPPCYNWIDGTSKANVVPKVIHYSAGGPWMADYEKCAFSAEWYRMYKSFMDDLPMPAMSLKSVNYGDLK